MSAYESARLAAEMGGGWEPDTEALKVNPHGRAHFGATGAALRHKKSAMRLVQVHRLPGHQPAWWASIKIPLNSTNDAWRESHGQEIRASAPDPWQALSLLAALCNAAAQHTVNSVTGYRLSALLEIRDQMAGMAAGEAVFDVADHIRQLPADLKAEVLSALAVLDDMPARIARFEREIAAHTAELAGRGAASAS